MALYPLEAFESQGQRASRAFGDTEFSCTPFVVGRKMAEAGLPAYNYELRPCFPSRLLARRLTPSPSIPPAKMGRPRPCPA